MVALKDGGVAVYIADICGHGMASAMLSIPLVTSLQRWAPCGDPLQVFKSIETEVPFERSDLYATVFYAVISADGRRVVYANAGHPRPIILNGYGNIRSLRDAGQPLGLGLGGDPVVAAESLSRGDRLLAFTDGVLERRNAHGEMFGMPRFLLSLERVRNAGVETMLDHLDATIEGFGGDTPVDDDQTMVLLEVKR